MEVRVEKIQKLETRGEKGGLKWRTNEKRSGKSFSSFSFLFSSLDVPIFFCRYFEKNTWFGRRDVLILPLRKRGRGMGGSFPAALDGIHGFSFFLEWCGKRRKREILL